MSPGELHYRVSPKSTVGNPTMEALGFAICPDVENPYVIMVIAVAVIAFAHIRRALHVASTNHHVWRLSRNARKLAYVQRSLVKNNNDKKIYIS